MFENATPMSDGPSFRPVRLVVMRDVSLGTSRIFVTTDTDEQLVSSMMVESGEEAVDSEDLLFCGHYAQLYIGILKGELTNEPFGLLGDDEERPSHPLVEMLRQAFRLGQAHPSSKHV